MRDVSSYNLEIQLHDKTFNFLAKNKQSGEPEPARINSEV